MWPIEWIFRRFRKKEGKSIDFKRDKWGRLSNRDYPREIEYDMKPYTSSVSDQFNQKVLKELVYDIEDEKESKKKDLQAYLRKKQKDADNR